MPEAKEKEIDDVQITFRLKNPSADILDKIASADKGIRRPSRHDVARKIVEDYLERGGKK